MRLDPGGLLLQSEPLLSPTLSLRLNLTLAAVLAPALTLTTNPNPDTDTDTASDPEVDPNQVGCYFALSSWLTYAVWLDPAAPAHQHPSTLSCAASSLLGVAFGFSLLITTVGRLL